MELPLNGIRILDVSRGVAASFSTMILADYGAEIIKIESSMGDTVRYTPPLYKGKGATFIALNRNKKSIQLDINKDEDRQKFLSLVPSADVVVENFRPGVMKKLNIDYEKLRVINPRIIFCSVTAFGQDGEWRDRPSHDNNLMGLSGLLNGFAAPGGAITQPVPLLAGMAGGSMWAVIGILLALEERRATGEGRHVDVSMFNGLQSLLIPELIAQIITGEEQVPGKTWNSGLFPGWNMYRTGDGRWMTLAAAEPKFWENFCEIFGRNDLKEFGFPYMDDDNKIRSEIADIIGSYTMDELSQLAEQKDILLEPVCTLAEALEKPPAKDFGSVFWINDKDGNTFPQIKLPLTFDKECSRNPHPSHGEHDSIYLKNNQKDPNIKKILVVYHSQGGTMKSIASIFAKGARLNKGVIVDLKKAGEASINDLINCDGLAVGSPEYLGYMAGAVKDFFDRTSEQVRKKTIKLPYVLFVCAENSGRETINQIEHIANGYQWKKILDTTLVVGKPDKETFEKISELGRAFSSHIIAGIY